MDNVSLTKRSSIMASVKSHGNKSTELALISIFKSMEISGWRRHYSAIGKPDFVFIEKRIALFIDGCFWHGCPTHCRIPKANREYWIDKISQNKNRDKFINKQLRTKGWIVFRIWEHELKSQNSVRKLKRILNQP